MVKINIDNTVKSSKRLYEENRRMWEDIRHGFIYGDLFGLTHSSVSRRVTIIRKKMALEQNFQRQVEAIKSQIKP
jgi:2-hydroxy-3-keto-5-methylthiopentenyl-1-phosphate phosphatase